MPTIPELPGIPVARRSPQEQWLKQHVARLCQQDHDRFPGSQPVSFTKAHLEKLELQDYWVCEKSDGVRVLLLVLADAQGQTVYIIDRHNTYREIHGLFFPHHEDPMIPLGNTVVDGELVIDVDPLTKQETLRFLAFDCLVADNVNVMSKSLDKRYGRLKLWFHKPYDRMLRDHPHMVKDQPFEIRVKEVRPSYHVDNVFAIDIPALQHGNDGLIYTCVITPYASGTDYNILKWKPPSENSIDFKLVLRFPPSPTRPSEPDFYAKPIFELHAWCGEERGGGQKYELYDIMYVDDDEWDQRKKSGEQLDDRIIEVHWDSDQEHWRMMRFRDDKPNGNHKSVVENIIKSIADGVEKEVLIARSPSIRHAWKMRESAQVSAPPPKPPVSVLLSVQPQSLPPLDMQYGPLAPSPWSKVSGPEIIAGMHR